MPGETLLTTLMRYNVSSVYNICEGGEDLDPIHAKPIDPMTYGPMCGSCRVIIHNPWFKQLNKTHPLEEKAILSNTYLPLHPNMRLACSLVVEKWMNEMTISIPSNTYEEPEAMFN